MEGIFFFLPINSSETEFCECKICHCPKLPTYLRPFVQYTQHAEHWIFIFCSCCSAISWHCAWLCVFHLLKYHEININARHFIWMVCAYLRTNAKCEHKLLIRSHVAFSLQTTGAVDWNTTSLANGSCAYFIQSLFFCRIPISNPYFCLVPLHKHSSRLLRTTKNIPFRYSKGLKQSEQEPL